MEQSRRELLGLHAVKNCNILSRHSSSWFNYGSAVPPIYLDDLLVCDV